MPETLLESNRVRLFGCVSKDIVLDFKPSDLPHNECLLEGQLMAEGNRLARIYGFSYLGQYCAVSEPALFLVHGDGVRPSSDVDTIGIARVSGSFPTDVRVWSYDKNDFSIRINVHEAGEGLLAAGFLPLIIMHALSLALAGYFVSPLVKSIARKNWKIVEDVASKMGVENFIEYFEQ